MSSKLERQFVILSEDSCKEKWDTGNTCFIGIYDYINKIWFIYKTDNYIDELNDSNLHIKLKPNMIVNYIENFFKFNNNINKVNYCILFLHKYFHLFNGRTIVYFLKNMKEIKKNINLIYHLSSTSK